MGLNPVEFGRITMDDLDAIADRAEAAARKMRESAAELRALVGVAPAPAAAPVHAAPQPTNNPRLSPAELAERERLLRNMRPEMPADIAAAEGMDQ